MIDIYIVEMQCVSFVVGSSNIIYMEPIPVAMQSKACVFGCSLAGIVESNPARGMDVSSECCVLSEVSVTG